MRYLVVAVLLLCPGVCAASITIYVDPGPVGFTEGPSIEIEGASHGPGNLVSGVIPAGDMPRINMLFSDHKNVFLVTYGDIAIHDLDDSAQGYGANYWWMDHRLEDTPYPSDDDSIGVAYGVIVEPFFALGQPVDRDVLVNVWVFGDVRRLIPEPSTGLIWGLFTLLCVTRKRLVRIGDLRHLHASVDSRHR